MIADNLMAAIDSVPELRVAYGNDPHFHAIVANVLNAANHGSDDIDQLRILLAGLAAVGAALGHHLDDRIRQAEMTPGGPWLIHLDGTLAEFNPEGGRQ